MTARLTSEVQPTARASSQVEQVFSLCTQDRQALDEGGLLNALTLLGKETSSNEASKLLTSYDKRQIELDEFEAIVASLVPNKVYRAFADTVQDSGSLDDASLGAALLALEIEIDPAIVKDVLREADANGSGEIELLEFASLVAEYSVPSGVLAAFDNADQNDSSGLDSFELRQALKKLGRDVDSSYAEQVLQKFDENQSGELELMQFARLVETLVPMDVLETFELYDRDENGGLDRSELKRALRSLGIDARSDDVLALLEAFDSTGTERLELLQFRALVSTLPTAAFWLKVDPSGSIRAFKRNAQKLTTAGTASKRQALHFAAGLGSLGFGLIHCFGVLINGFTSHVSRTEIMVCGAIYTLVAAAGVPLINWKNKNEAARNKMIWPAPILNAWLTCAALSVYGSGSSALFGRRNPAFVTFTAIILAIQLWQTASAWVPGGDDEVARRKSGIWFASPLVNMLVALVTFTGPIIAMTLQALFVDEQSYGKLLSSHQDYAYLVQNTFLNTAFNNCLAIFMASLLKYKVVNTRTLGFSYVPLQAAFIARILHDFVTCGGGQAKRVLVSCLFKSL